MTPSSILDGFLAATPMKAPPDEVKLSREEGEALIERFDERGSGAVGEADPTLLVQMTWTRLLTAASRCQTQRRH
jgi:hypothetical protein